MQGRKIERIREFDRELKKLSKKHHGLTKKVEDTLDKLAADSIPDGDQLSGFDEHPLFKIRCGTGTIGKRKGARIIYYKDDSGLGPLIIFLKNMKTDAMRKEITKRLMYYLQFRSDS